MVNGGGNGLGMMVAIGTVVAVAVLIGGYTASPSYAKVTKFESPFESSAIPLCGIEVVSAEFKNFHCTKLLNLMVPHVSQST